jgi:hypothetical protein
LRCYLDRFPTRATPQEATRRRLRRGGRRAVESPRLGVCVGCRSRGQRALGDTHAECLVVLLFNSVHQYMPSLRLFDSSCVYDACVLATHHPAVCSLQVASPVGLSLQWAERNGWTFLTAWGFAIFISAGPVAAAASRVSLDVLSETAVRM